MSKVTLTNLDNLENDQTAVTALNANNAAIQTGFDNTLSRDGTSPNTMLGPIDMNSHQIINLPPPSNATSAARLQDIGSLPNISLAFPSLVGDVTAPSNNGALTTTIDVGVWTNQRNGVSSATYTIQNSDNHKTVAFSASTPQIVTFSAPSAYTKSDFVCVCVNESSTSRKKMVSADASFTDFWLWPQQSCFMYKSSNGWRIQRDKRFQTYFALDLYVNSSGNDTNNDGMSTGSTRAFATIAKAFQVVQQEIDCVNTVTINLASNTYTDPAITFLGGTGFNTDVILKGDPTTPANVILASPGGSNTIQVRDGAILTVDGITFTGTAANSLNVDQGGVVDFRNCAFGANAGGIHLFAANQGTISWSRNVNGSASTYAITGNATYHMAAQFGGQITIANIATVQVSGGLTFNTFAFVDTTGKITVNTGLTYSTTVATGNKYNEQRPGVLTLNGVTLPCNTAGSTSSPGAGDISGTSLTSTGAITATTLSGTSSVSARSGTAVPAANTGTAAFSMYSTPISLYAVTGGNPTFTAAAGSLCIRVDGGANNRLFFTTGGGAWVACTAL